MVVMVMVMMMMMMMVLLVGYMLKGQIETILTSTKLITGSAKQQMN